MSRSHDFDYVLTFPPHVLAFERCCSCSFDRMASQIVEMCWATARRLPCARPSLNSGTPGGNRECGRCDSFPCTVQYSTVLGKIPRAMFVIRVLKQATPVASTSLIHEEPNEPHSRNFFVCIAHRVHRALISRVLHLLDSSLEVKLHSLAINGGNLLASAFIVAFILS